MAGRQTPYSRLDGGLTMRVSIPDRPRVILLLFCLRDTRGIGITWWLDYGYPATTYSAIVIELYRIYRASRLFSPIS